MKKSKKETSKIEELQERLFLREEIIDKQRQIIDALSKSKKISGWKFMIKYSFILGALIFCFLGGIAYSEGINYSAFSICIAFFIVFFTLLIIKE